MAGTPTSSRGRAWIAAIACALTTVAISAASAPAALNYPDFSSIAGLQLNGSAAQAGSTLRITPAAAGGGDTGSAFTENAVVKPDRSVKTRFEISMHDGFNGPGDGMAFVIQSKANTALGGGESGLGYSGLPHSLIVEFDTFYNSDANDPVAGLEDDHIALMKKGDSGAHIAFQEIPDNLYWQGMTPRPRYVWVSYSAKAKKIKVYADVFDTKPSEPLFSHKIDLKKILGGKKGFAGFTAATGSGLTDAQEDVLSWTLKSG